MRFLFSLLPGDVINYIVYDKYITSSNDFSIIAQSLNCREITLITCTNGGKNRLVIKAKEPV